MHALNHSRVVVEEVAGSKILHDLGQGSAAASMIEIVQGVISADVAGPLLNGVWGLETLETLPTPPEALGWDGVTVEEVALIRRAPEESHPMLPRQVDGIGIGNGAVRVRRLAGHQAPVVQRLDNAIHRINHYSADSVVCFVSTYPLDSDLSGG